jgi:hypothetical protein
MRMNDKSIWWSMAIKNSVCMVCWFVLAIIFGKWWIALFAALFMTSYETKHQYYRVCDVCGKHGPNADTYNSAIDAAKESGWIHITEGNKDYCPECKTKYKF